MRKSYLVLGLVSLACLGASSALGPAIQWSGQAKGTLGGCDRGSDGCWQNGNCQYQTWSGTECPGVIDKCNDTLVKSGWQTGNCGGCGYTWTCGP